MNFHEVAAIFPLMQDQEFEELKIDIKENGLREPIYIHEDKIIDGRNRYRACQELGIQPKYEIWNKQGSLVAFIISLNLRRRHLTASQKAIVALNILPWLEKEAKVRQVEAGSQYGENHPKLIDNKDKEVSPKLDKPLKARSDHQAGQMVGVGHSYVSEAKRLREEAPKIFEKVEEGRLTLQEGKQISGLPIEKHDQVIGQILDQKGNIEQKVNIKKIIHVLICFGINFAKETIRANI